MSDIKTDKKFKNFVSQICTFVHLTQKFEIIQFGVF